jgi:hypothetical protein
MLCAVLAQDAAHPLALLRRGDPKAGQKLALAFDGSPGDDPALRKPLEQQLRGPLPRVIDGGRRPVSPRMAVAYSSLEPGVSEPRSVSVLPAASV